MQKQSFLKWQILTVALMILGYSGYYLCRANFSVMLPQIIDDLKSHGMDGNLAKIRLGMIASLGVLGYAIGKVFSGGLSDYLGGRRNFLIGMLGTVGFTISFALGGGIPVFMVSFIGNRLFQSMGWAGMVKLTSRWFSYTSYGSVMGMISLSYLFGDAVSRRFMSYLIENGIHWRTVFFVNAAILFGLFLINFFFLKETPKSIGEEEPTASSNNLFNALDRQEKAPTIKDLLPVLFRSKNFWIIAVLSFGCTLIRETFNLWTPTYFTEYLGLNNVEAAAQSAWFPFFGGISVLLAGFLSDLLGSKGRSLILFFGLLLSAAVLMVLGNITASESKSLAIGIVSLVAFLLIGPYSYLGGAIALDFGGKQGSATVSGIIDGIGYLGGYVAGVSMAQISILLGWNSAFQALAGIAFVSSITAGFLLITEKKKVENPPLDLVPSLEPNWVEEGTG